MENITYNFYYSRIYKSLNKTNKSIPEWSSMLAISIFLAFNIFTVLGFFNFPFKSIGKIGFFMIPISMAILNYFYFIHTKRYKKIIKKYKNKKALGFDILILTYIGITFFLFQYSVGVSMANSILAPSVIVVIILIFTTCFR